MFWLNEDLKLIHQCYKTMAPSLSLSSCHYEHLPWIPLGHHCYLHRCSQYEHYHRVGAVSTSPALSPSTSSPPAQTALVNTTPAAMLSPSPPAPTVLINTSTTTAMLSLSPPTQHCPLPHHYHLSVTVTTNLALLLLASPLLPTSLLPTYHIITQISLP